MRQPDADRQAATAGPGTAYGHCRSWMLKSQRGGRVAPEHGGNPQHPNSCRAPIGQEAQPAAARSACEAGGGGEGFINHLGIAFPDRGSSAQLTPRHELRPAASTRRVFSVRHWHVAGGRPPQQRLDVQGSPPAFQGAAYHCVAGAVEILQGYAARRSSPEAPAVGRSTRSLPVIVGTRHITP